MADKETDPELIPLNLMAEVAQKGTYPTIGGELLGGILPPRGFNYRALGRFFKETKSHIFTVPSFLGLLLDEEIQKIGEMTFMPHDFELRTWQD